MAYDWRKYYKERLCSADDAVAAVNSGETVVNGHGLGGSGILDDALIRRADELSDVKIYCGFNPNAVRYCDEAYRGQFTLYSTHDTLTMRNAQREGRSQIIPLCFYQQERFFEELHPDVVLLQVTPPNAGGFVSMGVSTGYMRTAVDSARFIIAQVNRNMPWIDGDSVLHVTSIDCFVEADTPVSEFCTSGEVRESDLRIAEYMASLIDDGDTLQIGAGTIPQQVLKQLKGHKHIGIHTVLGSPGLQELLETGVIDNSMKTLDTGYCVCTLLGGDRKFYDFVHENPDFRMRRSSYVTNPVIIGQQKNMCCVNTAVEVDLMGKVAIDLQGYPLCGGAGGQLDFMRGASMSKGGRSIIGLPTTFDDGTSRIRASLHPGAVAANTRYDVQYIVTEYGIADLWGTSMEERAKALISIAHPDHRGALERDWSRML